MPRIDIYIRKDDVELWKDQYSPEWLHEILNKSSDKRRKNVEKVVAEVIKEETCRGHEIRWDCGLPGCKYA